MTALLLAIAVLAAGADEKVESLRLAVATGPAHVFRAPSVSEVEVVEGYLRPGDGVELGPQGRAMLDSPTLRLQAEGRGELIFTGPSQVQWSGARLSIWATGAPVQILTRSGSIQLQAGNLRLHEQEGRFYVELLEGGQAGVFGPNGFSMLQRGTGIAMEAAGHAATPVALPKVPELVFPPAHASPRAFRFHWRAIPDASAYRLEVARDASFHDLVYSGETTQPSLIETAQSLPIGLLYWRVIARGANGIEGVPSQNRPLRIGP